MRNGNGIDKILLVIIFTIILGVFLVIIDKISSNNSKPINNTNNATNTIIVNDPELILLGEKTITLQNGEKYIDPGYYGIKSDGSIDNDVLVIGNNFDTTDPGTYIIKYTYNNLTKTRTIIVLEPEKKEETYELILELKGDADVTLELNHTYDDPKVIAKYGDLNLEDKVIINSNLDNTKVGSYKITYTLEYEGIKKELVRNINVVDNSLNLIFVSSTTSYTNQNITLSVNIEGDSYDYVVLPNNTTTKDRIITYEITENGRYTFKAYNKSGVAYSKSIVYSNIDRTNPTGKCSATINKNNTVFSVNATDNIKISKYIYYDNSTGLSNSSSPSFTYNSKTSKDLYVKVVDVAGNDIKIKCDVTDNSYDKPILPEKNENVIFKGETNTLKVYISKFSSYYLTRIWAYNPYSQANKHDSPEYGSKLYRPSELLGMATNDNNLKNKLLVGFNASGFYLKDKYDPDSVNLYPKYNKTSVGTIVITNGKVIRNVYDPGDVVTWFITGIDKNNKMVVFTDLKRSATTVAEKKKWSQTVINSGIRNTYTFAAPIILEGKKTSYNSSNSRMPGANNIHKELQLLCQINDNNFVLFTTTDSTRNTGIEKFLELGCQTAVNLDGGGSVALIYKEKNSETIKTVIGNGRALPEVGYFSE